jgi:glycosyltransferase involved in cell wall biosynthesis
MCEVILPVLDEVQAIPTVLGALPPGYQAIVVDNGSRDGSAACAAKLGARVIHEPMRGFGAACHAGLCAARGEIVCVMDCDGSLDPRDLPRLVAPIAQNIADLTLGRRRPLPGSWPAHARLANSALALMLRMRWGVTLHDLGPMRAARREALLELHLTDRAFAYPLEMVMRAAQERWRVSEIPVTYSPRIGQSKVTGTLKGSLRATSEMARILAVGPPA